MGRDRTDHHEGCGAGELLCSWPTWWSAMIPVMYGRRVSAFGIYPGPLWVLLKKIRSPSKTAGRLSALRGERLRNYLDARAVPRVFGGIEGIKRPGVPTLGKAVGTPGR
ncbi:hypothetical protein ACQP1G_40375 [Nocardia sp. CA-107356]|uniref:hypothetical protein n=1 Tax=Nocardia sp. CA-107356 TaxID=3239972 RepID=UPI003D94F9F7